MAFSHTGYTTNLPLADVTGGKAWITWSVDGGPLPVDHGGPARMIVPHLYFWKSTKWVAGLRLMRARRARVLGAQRLPRPRRSLARAALPGRLTPAYDPAMQVEVLASPSFAFATITIPAGGELHAEAGSMAAYSDGVEVETKARGGMMAGLRRSVLGGESFFINTFRAPSGGSVSVAPALPGDMALVRIEATQALMVQSGSWIASDPGVEVDTKWGGAKTFFSGEGLFLLRAPARATCWCRATGRS